MDHQTQLTRPYGHDQTEEPIRSHHPEEEGHHEKGAASKVLKKVKEKAKKMKNTLTKHGHGHGHEEEEEDEYEEEPEVHGAPVYESSAVRGGVTGQPRNLIHPEETNVLTAEEITPPGTKVFPVVSTKPTEPVKDSEPLRGLDASYRDETTSHPLRVSDLADRGESREAHLMPMNIRREDESFGQRKVNIDMPIGLEEDPVPLGGGTRDLSGVANYQSKVTDPSEQGGGEAGVPGIVESLGKMKMTDESPVRTSGIGFETDLSRKSHGDDEVKVEASLGSDLPTGTHDQFSPELTPPKKREDLDSKTEEIQEPKGSTYTEKIVSATSVIADKAIAAKNAVASKLGYSTESSGGEQETQAPRSATEYGHKVAGTVAEKLTPVYEKVKETGSNVMTKLPLSGGGSGAETQQGDDKGVSAREYLAEKLRPGEEDKTLSEVIAEKLHLGGETKTVTKEVTVTVEKKSIGKDTEEEGKGGGVVKKLRGAVPTWLGGTTAEVKEKSSESTEESSQSLGSTVGTMGFGAVPGQTKQESGN